MNKKGFTLVEVLIAAAIIGVLAALIIPQMISQPEKAKIAEAQQMIGVIKRAERRYLDTTGAESALFLNSEDPGSTVNWIELGLNMPPMVVNGGNWAYTTETDGFVVADRSGAGQGRITAVVQGFHPEGWAYRDGFMCTGTYEQLDVTDPTKGCTPRDGA